MLCNLEKMTILFNVASMWQVWGRGASLWDGKQLTIEQAKFCRVTNKCTYSHKDVGGILMAASGLTCLLSAWFGYAWSFCVGVFVLIAGCIITPLSVVYILSALLTACIRTDEFLDLAVHFPGHAVFTSAEIRREVRAFIASHRLVATKDTFNGENAYIGSGSTKDGNTWRIHLVKVMNGFCKDAAIHFPILRACLLQRPEVLSCAVSVLEPGVKIPMHMGYHKGILRYMVAVDVPTDKTGVWLNVNGLVKHWEEGRDFLWDDMYPHAVYNTTNQTRVVLYMDILRTADMHFILAAANRALMGLVKATGIADKEVSKTETTILL